MTNELNTMTTEQLRAALAQAEEREQAEKEARERQEAEARERERNERLQRECEARVARDRALLAPIVAAVRAAKVQIDDDGDVPGAPEADLHVENETRKVNSFRWTETGRQIIVVGQSYLGPNHERPVRFPQRKDGSHNVEKIAALIVERATNATARRERKRQEQDKRGAAQLFAEFARSETASSLANRIVGAYEVWSEHARKAFVYTAAPGKVFVEVGRVECTPEQARAILAALEPVLAKPRSEA